MIVRDQFLDNPPWRLLSIAGKEITRIVYSNFLKEKVPTGSKEY
ncbi:MAG: hypothetical protein QMB24_15050 [Spirosomataceae bacterium]